MSAMKVKLGRHLFYDTRLSGNETFACAGCHSQERAFTDGRNRALGSTGQIHPRGAMSLTNVAFNATLGWADPTLKTLEAQARVPMFNENPVELGLARREEEMLERLRTVLQYRHLFTGAFPGEADPFTLSNVLRALASFERTLISGSSPYDRLTFQDEQEALTASARRGMQLYFSDRIPCSKCHGGFNFSGPVRFEGAKEPKARFHNTGLYNVDGSGAVPPDNPGLAEHTGRRRDQGRFRAPTLRNIAVTAPYMHDGSIATLEHVINHYARGGRIIKDGPLAGDGRLSPRKSELLEGFEIDAEERADLVAFLASLTDEGFLRDSQLADPWPRN
jgi:cytochrome c peroxidase